MNAIQMTIRIHTRAKVSDETKTMLRVIARADMALPTVITTSELARIYDEALSSGKDNGYPVWIAKKSGKFSLDIIETPVPVDEAPVDTTCVDSAQDEAEIIMPSDDIVDIFSMFDEDEAEKVAYDEAQNIVNDTGETIDVFSMFDEDKAEKAAHDVDTIDTPLIDDSTPITQPSCDMPIIPPPMDTVQTFQGFMPPMSTPVPVNVPIIQNNIPPVSPNPVIKCEAPIPTSINTDVSQDVLINIIKSVIVENAGDIRQFPKNFVSKHMLESKTAMQVIGHSLRYNKGQAKVTLDEKEKKAVDKVMEEVIKFGNLKLSAKGTGFVVPMQTMVAYGKECYSELKYEEQARRMHDKGEAKFYYIINLADEKIVAHRIYDDSVVGVRDLNKGLAHINATCNLVKHTKVEAPSGSQGSSTMEREVC